MVPMAGTVGWKTRFEERTEPPEFGSVMIVS
jgi:hypothetical protein